MCLHERTTDVELRSACASVGYYLPELVMTGEDVNRKIAETTGFKLTNGLIERLTGVKSRHYRAPDEQSSDLAAKAAKQAMDRAGISPSDVDLLIFAACTQDIAEPATANILQEKLGCMKAQVCDIKNACNSFLNGMDMADSYIRTGKSRCAVVAVGETLSQFIDWSIRSTDDLKTRIGSLTLGDAGAAVVLTGVPKEENRGMLTSQFRSYGDKWRLATVLAGGSMYRTAEEHSYFRCESIGLREAAYEFIPGVVAQVFEEIGWKPEDVDLGCGHQVTLEMVYGVQERCGVQRGREIVTITDCGNTAAASIPLCLGRAFDEGRLERGTKVLLVGGAAGFSVGVIPLIW